MLFQTRNGAALLLLGIITAAGYTLWCEGPGLARQRAQRDSQVVSDVKQLCVAAQMYAEDHNEKLPDAANWEREVRPYLGAALPDFALPATQDGKRHRIAINTHVAGRNLSELASPSSAVLFFESTAVNSNAADELQSLPHDELEIAIGYADGHVYNHQTAWKQWFQEPKFHREALGELALPLTAKK